MLKFYEKMGFGIVIISLFILSCKNEAPTQQKEIPKGTFIQKVVYLNWSKFFPRLTAADLYDNEGVFNLYNVNYLTDNAVMPNLSPDQKWIAYIFVENGRTLKRINIDGSDNEEIFLRPAHLVVDEAKISGDNSTLVVTVGSIGDLYIATISLSNGVSKRITSNAWSHSPSWAPDGKRIYFTWVDVENRFHHNVDPLYKAYIASIDKDGSNLSFISDTTNGISDDSEPNISPDGKTIAFYSTRNHPNNIIPEIFSMDITGNNIHQITESKLSPKHEDHFDYYNADNYPKWLPDNEHIIFYRNHSVWDHSQGNYTSVEDIYIINRDGTGLQNLTNNGVVSFYKR